MKPYAISVPDAQRSAIREKVAGDAWDPLPEMGAWYPGVDRAGGHFAALEQPELLLADLHAFIATTAGDRS